MDQDFSQDDEYIVGWDGDDNIQPADQSQDDRDAVSTVHMQLIKITFLFLSKHSPFYRHAQEAVLHSRYNYAARKRLGLVGREQDGSMLMGSEDLARNLQQRSPPPADLQQTFNNILLQYKDPDMPPPSPAFHQSDAAHLLPGHGNYSPKPNQPNLQAAANSPASAYSPHGRYHAPVDSPGSGGRLTAASQATGAALRAGQFRPRSAAPPILGGGGVVVAGGIEVDEELLNAYQLQQATSPPNSKKKDTRRFQQQQQGVNRRAAPPSFHVTGTGAAGGSTMATPGPNPIASNNPLLSLLASAKNNGSGGRSTRGGGTPAGRQPSSFRQPEYGSPEGYAYGASGAVTGPSRFQREQQRNMAYNTPGAAAMAAPAATTPAPGFPQQQQQQQQQQEAQDIILSSDEEDHQNPDAIAAAAARNTAGIDTPVAAHVAAFGANAGAAGTAPGSSGDSAGRLTGLQDSFLAGLAPPSARLGHGNARSRLGGGGGASGSGLQGRLKRVRTADENAAAAAAAAAAASSNSNTNTFETVIQARGMECNVFKVRGLCRNSELVDFFLPSPAAAQRADLALGRKIVIKGPYRKVATGSDGIELFFCTGDVSAK